MSNAKKIIDRSGQIKKPREKKKKRLKVDLDQYEDAVIMSEWVVKVGDPVMFERNVGGAIEIHTGHVHSFNERGDATLWDDTQDQFYLKSKLGTLKVKTLTKVSIPQENT